MMKVLMKVLRINLDQIGLALSLGLAAHDLSAHSFFWGGFEIGSAVLFLVFLVTDIKQ